MAVPSNTSWFLYVRFEQGRGMTGVPKTWVPYLTAHPKNPQAKPAAETLVRMAVELLRAQCADPETGHGRDLMPPGVENYRLHNLDGGLINHADDIRWQDTAGTRVAEVVLTWRNPAGLLADQALTP